MTKNEILTALNKPEDFILAIVVFPDEGEPRVCYVREPFEREPDFGAVSVNYKLDELLAQGGRRGDAAVPSSAEGRSARNGPASPRIAIAPAAPLGYIRRP